MRDIGVKRKSQTGRQRGNARRIISPFVHVVTDTSLKRVMNLGPGGSKMQTEFKGLERLRVNSRISFYCYERTGSEIPLVTVYYGSARPPRVNYTRRRRRGKPRTT